MCNENVLRTPRRRKRLWNAALHSCVDFEKRLISVCHLTRLDWLRGGSTYLSLTETVLQMSVTKDVSAHKNQHFFISAPLTLQRNFYFFLCRVHLHTSTIIASLSEQSSLRLRLSTIFSCFSAFMVGFGRAMKWHLEHRESRRHRISSGVRV